MDNQNLNKQIQELEAQMNKPDFWSDKELAQKIIRTIKDLKESLSGNNIYDKGNAIITILAGAGGDDSEDFSRMLLEMYARYADRKGCILSVIDKNQNSLGGYRSVTVEVIGKNAYLQLKNESGVHRLVRMSPFNSKGLRHTSFSMVEVIPVVPLTKISLLPEDVRIELSKSSGPGGQNVNKRETAVRIVHLKTNISSSASGERSQEANRQKAFEMLASKLFKHEEDNRKAHIEGRQVSKTTEIEWGSQIRSYVLHPYKLVKDHRTLVETSDTDSVLGKGDIDMFIEAEKDI